MKRSKSSSELRYDATNNPWFMRDRGFYYRLGLYRFDGAMKQSSFQFDEQLHRFIDQSRVPQDRFCVAGSVPLAIRDIRKNKDIDLIIDCNINFETKPNFIDFTSNSFECVGYRDKEIVNQANLHDKVDGLKIIRPEILFSYKCHHRRDKDVSDINALEEYAFNNPTDWDWSLVTYTGLSSNHSAESKREFLYNTFDYIKNNGILKTIKLGWKMYPKEILSRLYSDQKSKVDKLRNVRGVLQNSTYISIHGNIPKLLAKQHWLGNSERIYNYVGNLECIFEESDFQTKEAFLNDSIEGDIGEIHVSTSGVVENVKYFSCILFLRLNEHKISFGKKKSPKCEFGELFKNTIDEERIDEIKLDLLRDYGLIFPAIIWPPVSNNIKEIAKIIDSDNVLVCINSFDLSGEDLNDFLWDLYATSPNPDWSIEKKHQRLSSEEGKYYAIEIGFPGDPDTHSQLAKKLKSEVRNSYKEKIEDYFEDIILHMGDDYKENRHIYDTLRKHDTGDY